MLRKPEKKYFIPFLVPIILCAVFSLMMYPLLKSPLGSSMGLNSIIMPTMLMSLLSSISILFFLKPKTENRRIRLIAYGIQLGYTLVISLLISVAAPLVAVFGGSDIPFGEVMLFVWLASFGMITLFIGAANIHKIFGIVVIAGIFIFGMFLGLIPAVSMLPGFWENCIAPWVPQRYLGEGLRAVISPVGSPDTACIAFSIIWAVGILFMVGVLFLPQLLRKIKAGKKVKPDTAKQ
jgi:hypothetical protein